MVRAVMEWDSRISRRIKLRDLHILSAVVERGSMAKAAKQMRMSQPSISESIANLEAALHVRLLDRNSRGIEPTIYAQALLKHGNVVFDELQQGIRDIEFLADPTAGEVRIGCPENLSAGFVPAIVDQLLIGHPRVIVRMASAETAALDRRELRERTVDLMLGRLFQPNTNQDYNTEVLFEDEYFVVAGDKSPFAQRRKIALAELVNERWVFLPPNNVPSAFYANAFHADGLEMPRECVTSFSMHLRLHLLATGRFLTVLPISFLRFNAERWSLRALPVELKMPRVPVVIFTLKNRTLSPVVQLFIEHARMITKSMQPAKHLKKRPIAT